MTKQTQSETQEQDHLALGQKFLKNNLKKPGVRETESGLQYKVLKKSKGAKPKINDIVVTHYRGTLIDGTEFDSSYRRNQTVEFALNQVIPGWTEALQMMHVGSKWALYIPAQLAYGNHSPSADIPDNATLIFEIELQAIKP